MNTDQRPHLLENPASRASLRRQMRQKRRALPPRRRRQWSQRILKRLTSLPMWRAARCVALYQAADGEVDTSALIPMAIRQGKKVTLPRLHRHTPFWMDFIPYRPGIPLKRNRFGIAEPVGRVLHPAARIDLVLMPLVGFDRRGHRLGMGSGYYDRRFAFTRRRAGLPPRLCGLAYGFQAVPALDSAPWDIPLRSVITEQGWIRCFSP
ncbi:MAG: 5-formyltetrahydrofolate cyclo-ligase [Pseudomonadota bacterium]|nr:5-formyltetrahydrofolate cyclo-ligase [Pseudomonadota bacterium]